MGAFTELNVKEGMPRAVDAMDYLKKSLASLRKNKCKCVLVIHGYGSTGKGGVIHDLSRQWLKAQERNGKVKTVLFGEDFTIFDPKALELKNRYGELKELFYVCNNGVTVVEL